MSKRKTVPLGIQLHKQLNKYASMAAANTPRNQGLVAAAAIGALGLANLALPEFLHAEVVFRATNQTVGNGGHLQSTLQVDVNWDGIPDLQISAYNYFGFSSGFHIRQFLSARGLGSNQILTATSHLAANLRLGRPINSTGNFSTHPLMAECIISGGGLSSFKTYRGNWLIARNRFLGIKFSQNAKVHYGWARLSTSCGTATLTGYAYETIPGKPIITSFPTVTGTLGSLARGRKP